jgi:excisionase family DNA binding protein
LTLVEAARLSGHAAVSLRQAIHRGSLRATKVGSGNRATYLVARADLDAYLAQRHSWRGYHPTTEEVSHPDE